MTRNLCHWLATLALVAAPMLVGPATAKAQQLVGQSRLAPVALEARCRFADSMLDGPSYLVALGSDPLHAGILAEDARRATDAAPVVAEVPQATATIANQHCEPFPAPKPFCPFAELAAAEPIDIECPDVAMSDAERTSDAEAPSPSDDPVSIVHAAPQTDKAAPFTGSAPIIVTLDEADLPIDLVRNPPFHVSLQPLVGPRFCLLANAPASPLAPVSPFAPASPLAPIAQPASPNPSSWNHLIPSPQTLEAIQDAVVTLQPAMPVECWMEEVVWNAELALAHDGPIRQHIDPRQAGEHVANLSRDLLQAVTDWSRPAIPVLAQSIDPNPQPAAADLQIAVRVLDSAASELESLAGQLRHWSLSLHRVARSQPGTLQR